MEVYCEKRTVEIGSMNKHVVYIIQFQILEEQEIWISPVGSISRL